MVQNKLKNLKKIYIYPGSPSIKIYYYSLFDYELIFWGDVDKNKSMSMPKSEHFYEYSANSRDQVEAYFTTYYTSTAFDPILLSYIKKHIIMGYPDYYAFRKAIPVDNSSLIISPSIFSDIYENRKPKFRLSILYIIVASYIGLIKIFLSSFYFSLITKTKKDLPDIIYIRKKIYHDLGIGDLIGKSLFDKKIKYEKIFWAFSKKSSTVGFNFLNAYKGSTYRSIISFIQVLYYSIKDLKYFFIYFLPPKFYKSLQTESYIARNFINLNAKIFCGTLVDKPFYVLLSRYKKNKQLLCSINESFFYPPYRSFDYNHLDVYYAMNDIDRETININGGEIKEYNYVEFFREKLITTSDGISQELDIEIKKYKHTILIATIQSPHYIYIQWSPDDLRTFVLSIYNIAEKMPDNLFILKGKKGELNYLSNEMRNELENQNNIFIIDSEVPRALKHNQFEDLISISDVLISMSHTSTTIWQFISNNKPAIAVNQNHPYSFLRGYDFLEVRLNQLYDAITYWLNLSDSDWNDIKSNIIKRVNLGNGEGLTQMADDIIRRIDAAKA